MVNPGEAQTKRRSQDAIYAGPDLGTSKIGLSFVTAQGQHIWAAAAELPQSHVPANMGFLVQRPSDWLKKAVDLFWSAVKNRDVSDNEAVGVTATTPTLLLLDRDGSLVVDEAIIWSDPNRVGPTDPSGRNVGMRKLAAIAQMATGSYLNKRGLLVRSAD